MNATSLTEDLVARLRDARPRLNEVQRRQADDLLTNVRLYGAGYSQRTFMRSLIEAAQSTVRHLTLVA